jgi:hypothetical protein
MADSMDVNVNAALRLLELVTASGPKDQLKPAAAFHFWRGMSEELARSLGGRC